MGRIERDKRLTALGIELSTTACSIGGRNAAGEEFYATVPMLGATKWNDMSAFDLTEVPGMIRACLVNLAKQLGLDEEHYYLAFAGNGALCMVVRQHDMVLVGNDGKLLMPALSWQANQATEQVQELKAQGAEAVVGPIEARFVLPKLLLALKLESGLREQIRYVMTTGDWINWIMAGMMSRNCRLSTSDALCNGLLGQHTKLLAKEVIKKAGLDPRWFPEPILSDRIVGKVQYSGDDFGFGAVSCWLEGWQICADLGDNHATALGTGLVDGDLRTAFASFGTSGTVTRLCSPGAQLAGKAACFEFFDWRLLLAMLADCGARWTEFKAKYADGKSDGELSRLAMEFEAAHQASPAEDASEIPAFDDLPLPAQAATIQKMIGREMAGVLNIVLREVLDRDTPPIEKVVMTGGLIQSELLRGYFTKVIQGLGLQAFVSDRQGPLATQTGVAGGLIQALVANGTFPDRKAAVQALCPLRQLG